VETTGAHRRDLGGDQHTGKRHPVRTLRISWPRFASIFVPALLSLALLAVGAATGAVPVALAIEGRQGLKVTVKQASMQGAATFPQFFRTHQGERRTVVVVNLRDLKLRALCVSTRVETPVGAYVLRITGPDTGQALDAGDVTFALDTVDNMTLDGDHVALNSGEFTDDRIPRDKGIPDYLPIDVDGLTLNLNATLRWVTADRFHLQGITLAGGLDQRECY
jgi:hypothetical protein